MDTQRPADHREIEDCLLSYVRGVDRKNWDQVRSAYHTDAFDDHGGYKGNIDGFIESLVKRHATVEQSMHVVSNLTIEFAGPDSALAESYFITHQRISPEAGDARLPYLRGAPIRPDQAVETEVVGRYVDHMTRRDGAWRIQRRTVVFEVFRGQPAPAGGGLDPNWALSRRDGNDPLEHARRELGLR
jgi:hypothetical protein